MISPSGSDDTPAIQAALNSKGYAELDSGDFHVTSINMADGHGLALTGKGSLRTKLIPTQSGVNVIDCVGTTNPLLRDFRIAAHGQPVTPTTGILLGQKQGNAGADVFALDGVRVDGAFGVAALYCNGVQSSRMIGGQFYNYTQGGCTAIFVGNNLWGVQSHFTSISTANDMPVSDWEIIACEFHNLNFGWALWLGACQQFKFRGGNASSSAPIVSNNSLNMAQGLLYPHQTIFDGTTFYSDYPPSPAQACQGLVTAPHMIFRDVHSTMPLT